MPERKQPEGSHRSPARLAALAPSARKSAIAERPEPRGGDARRAAAPVLARDFLLFGAGLVASAAAGWWLLPERAEAHVAPGSGRRPARHAGRARRAHAHAARSAVEPRAHVRRRRRRGALLERPPRAHVRAARSATPLRNNYHGRTPGPEYPRRLDAERCRASPRAVRAPRARRASRALPRVTSNDHAARLRRGLERDVAGWAVALRRPARRVSARARARWAALRSMVSLDGARAARALLRLASISRPRATRRRCSPRTTAGAPLTLAHGAPLRLAGADEAGAQEHQGDHRHRLHAPTSRADYWNERGYSKYDGL